MKYLSKLGRKAYIDLGSVTKETKGSEVGILDIDGTQRLPVGLSRD